MNNRFQIMVGLSILLGFLFSNANARDIFLATDLGEQNNEIWQYLLNWHATVYTQDVSDNGGPLKSDLMPSYMMAHSSHPVKGCINFNPGPCTPLIGPPTPGCNDITASCSGPPPPPPPPPPGSPPPPSSPPPPGSSPPPPPPP